MHVPFILFLWYGGPNHDLTDGIVLDSLEGPPTCKHKICAYSGYKPPK